GAGGSNGSRFSVRSGAPAAPLAPGDPPPPEAPPALDLAPRGPRAAGAWICVVDRCGIYGRSFWISSSRILAFAGSSGFSLTGGSAERKADYQREKKTSTACKPSKKENDPHELRRSRTAL